MFSIKTGTYSCAEGASSTCLLLKSLGRQRAYWERDDLFHGPEWGGAVVPKHSTCVVPPASDSAGGAACPFPWPTVDYDDASDPLAPQLPSGQKLPGHQYYPQVYTVDAIAVESLMVGPSLYP